MLQPCLKTPQAEALASFLETQLELQGGVLPLQEQWFKAFKLTPFNQVKGVLLGQAHGLSFSVNQGIKTPPSLRNILKELTADLAIQTSTHGDLSQWALQGVLLLNTVLTVAQSQAGAHQGKGWEAITDAVIKALSEQSSGLVFMLWGKPAQAKAALIDTNKHWILQAVHPSPLSAYRGFFGCGHFSKANVHLSEQGLSPIDWQRTPLLKEARQIQLL